MSYLTSHIYLMILLALSGIVPPYPVVRPNLFPYWYEWLLLVMLSGLLLFELTNPSDKSGLGFIKLLVLLFGMAGVGVHVGKRVNLQLTGTLIHFKIRIISFPISQSINVLRSANVLANGHVLSKSMLCIIIFAGLRSNIGFLIISSFVRTMGHHYRRFDEGFGSIFGCVGNIRVWIFDAYRCIESTI